MENIQTYIDKVRDFINKNEDVTEALIIRYVYLDLGKRFSFNPEYIPFGNGKVRQSIYAKAEVPQELDKSFVHSFVICNYISKILTKVLTEFGIDIEECTDPNDERKCPHVYNIVRDKNGNTYEIDLQEDMYYIKMRARTPNYTLASREEQEKMDFRLEYISNENYYTDEYLDFLGYYAECINSPYERFKFIIDNINAFDNDDKSYTDRQWYHAKVLEKFFDPYYFNYLKAQGKIKFIDAYKEINGKKKLISGITYQEGSKISIFLFNEKIAAYKEISYENFLIALENGLKLYRCPVSYLEKDYQRIIEKNRK